MDMDESRYHEILPVAFMVAALEKGKMPSSVSVGRAACAIEEMEQERDGAYRIAMAQHIPAEIIGVKRVTTPFGVDKFHVTYRPLGKDTEVEEMNTPLVNHKTLGASTNAIWNRFNQDGTNKWDGKRMMLYKHNDPPREGDRSQQGYRCCVYAEPLD